MTSAPHHPAVLSRRGRPSVAAGLPDPSAATPASSAAVGDTTSDGAASFAGAADTAARGNITSEVAAAPGGVAADGCVPTVSSGRAADVEAGRAALPAFDNAEWQARLLAAAEESNRARAARAAERREKAARRKAGMASRHAWRQLHLDARAADADRSPPN